ncbi:MAG TPA: hypothetical protein VF221_05960 [Chloroflexota bacterium]
MLTYATLWRVLARDSGAGRARGALRAWDAWERVSEWIWPIQPIPGARSGILRIRLAPYRGSAIRLRDGTVVHRGAVIGHIHLNNMVAASITAESLWQLHHMAVDDLHALAAWIQRQSPTDRPIALYGRTLLGHAARRVGFSSSPCATTPGMLLFRLYLHGLIVMHSAEGWRRMRRGHVRSAPCSDIWMSTNEFLRRYGNK